MHTIAFTLAFLGTSGYLIVTMPVRGVEPDRRYPRGVWFVRALLMVGAVAAALNPAYTTQASATAIGSMGLLAVATALPRIQRFVLARGLAVGIGVTAGALVIRVLARG